MPILHSARFYTTVADLEQLPLLGLPELAFAGRSNAGKSSAINTLCAHKRLAFASKTPGRTQHLNYFAIGKQPDAPALPAAFLVDLPGYGYAEAGHAAQASWVAQLGAYLQRRDALVGLVLIMDARHAPASLDLQLLDWFAQTGKPVHALLTKCDKLNRSEGNQVLARVSDTLRNYGHAHTVQLFSSLKNTGVEPARARVIEMLGLVEDEIAVFASPAKKRAPTQGE